MAGAAERSPSLHSLQLDDEEQLQIALALSLDDAGDAAVTSAAAADDERLARRLQEAEYLEAARHQQHPPLAAAAASPSSTGGGPPHLAAGSAGGAAQGSSAGWHASSSGGSGVMDGLRAASVGAAQRLSSGGSQLWQGLRRMVDPQQAQQPYHQPPVAYHQPQQGPPQPAHHRPVPAPHPEPSQRHGAPQPPRTASWQSQPPQQQQQQQQHVSEDEALAHALQQQFDLEEQQARQRQQQAPPPRLASGPLGANLAAAAAAGRPSTGAASTQAAPAQQAPAGRTPPVAPQPEFDRRRCGGCGGSLYGLLGARSPFIAALGRNWHPGCLVCAGCSRPIGERGGVPFCERGGRLYHLACHRAAFHPKCDVCANYCPEEANRRIVWSELPFWSQRFCPQHAEDGTPRCTACDRLRPHTKADRWAELEDGRHICLPCLDTITTDTRDAQPLWQNVLSFYASVGMPLPAVPPMMLVDAGALNEAEGQETNGRGRDGPVFHVRGLTLTEEYRSIRTILRIPGGNPFAVQRRAVPVGPTHTEVTGILVLYGLPRLLTGSILAHECMHAWLRMSGFTSHQQLPEQVEEGLCQLMAYLWLEAQQAQTGFKDAYEERLAAYFAHQIRSDVSETYGDGFRMAHESFQQLGLGALLAHVQRLGTFPPQ